jgi:hypothetical protein
MEATTSTGLLRVRIILCVTGDVLESIRIDATLKIHTRGPMDSRQGKVFGEIKCKESGLMNIAAGNDTTNEKHCTTAITFKGCVTSFLWIKRFVTTVLIATLTFEAIAA